MSSTFRILVIASTAVSAAAAVLAVAAFRGGTPQAVYINVSQVQEGFSLSQRRQQQLKQIQQQYEFSLDTLLRKIPEHLRNDGRSPQIQHYLATRKQMREALEHHTQAHLEEIAGVLNTYYRDFGYQNNYPCILGANGDGSLLHADSTSDVTARFIEYANQRYAQERGEEPSTPNPAVR